MLSTQYRLRLEFICQRIADGEEVKLEDMIWCEKISKVNPSAAKILRQARRRSMNTEMKEGDLDDFLNQMDLGNPDPSYHKTSFDSADEIAEWFHRDDNDDERRRRD